MKRIAKTDNTVDPAVFGCQQTGHPPTHGLATDDNRAPITHLRPDPGKYIPETLQKPGPTIRWPLFAILPALLHIRKLEPHRRDFFGIQRCGQLFHKGRISRCTGTMGQNQYDFRLIFVVIALNQFH